MEYERDVKDKLSKPSRPPPRTRARWAEAAAVGLVLIGAAVGCEQDLSPVTAVEAHRAAATPPARTLNLQNDDANVEAVPQSQGAPTVATLQDNPDATRVDNQDQEESLAPSAPSEGIAATIVNTCQDDSEAPVHVQVKACATTSAQGHQSLDCTLDAGYALVGGGAYAQWYGEGALLTASRYVDGRTWRGASKDHGVSDPHYLVTFPIGLRLDGVNAATLRGLLGHNSVTAPASPTSHPSASMARPQGGTSAGAQTNTSGPGQLLTRVVMDTSTASVASKDHWWSSPGTITDSATSVNGTFGPGTIIEGFGALEFQYMSATPSTVSSGIASSVANVSGGWALAGWGGDSTYTEPGRLLFRIGPNSIGANCHARSVIVQSKDHLGASAGTTTAWWTQVRKVPGSHGLCNPGGALTGSMDPCVASICAVDSYCCNNNWDPQCVSEVASICGRSCSDYSCGISSYNPTFWNDGGTVQWQNNCYNYGNNRRTDTFAQVGRASGESDGTVDVATVTRRAVNDGLISTTLAVGCGDGRELIAMVIKPDGDPDWHWYRRDANNYWTHKQSWEVATNLDNSDQPITNPETADRGDYTVWGGYFCSCSSATEGAGHAVIN